MNKKSFGTSGEEITIEYLISKGYEINEKNWRFSNFGEIDIIAVDKKVDPILVFIEVKTRSSASFACPVESVGITKQKKIKKLADIYITYNKLYDINVRFDVVEIIINTDEILINHLECAFW